VYVIAMLAVCVCVCVCVIDFMQLSVAFVCSYCIGICGVSVPSCICLFQWEV